MNNSSLLEKFRKEYIPLLPQLLTKVDCLKIEKKIEKVSSEHAEQLQKLFPHSWGQPLVELTAGNKKLLSQPMKVGVVLSGGQASGGHNVISGIFDAIKKIHPESTLIGFLGGPSGIIQNQYIEITTDLLSSYRNTGGFDIIGSGRTKIETTEQLEASLKTVTLHKLKGLVIIGGDDSNTNAAILAEYFLTNQCSTRVIGCPKTIDGDLKNEWIEISFGFDTASKTYSEMIGNICRDALSAKKYYHFIKLMGRSASHITLECALQTQPNLAFIGEEILAKNKTLSDLIHEIAMMIVARSEKKKDYGVILIPEGLIEFIPEIKILIKELNQCLSDSKLAHSLDQMSSFEEKKKLIYQHLHQESQHCFEHLPTKIQEQLLLERDPHGNVQVSQIETEQLLIHKVKEELKNLKTEGKYKGKFNPVNHFFGYEGRAGFPSNFDATYCYALGFVAASLISSELTGYICSIKDLHLTSEHWKAYGIPITMLMNLENRHGKLKPVIQKALVEIKGKPFTYFSQQRNDWQLEDVYKFPGPIQFAGPDELCNAITKTLELEKHSGL